MEQRSEPSIEPELTVGTDPADVPGLLGPRPTAAEPAERAIADPEKAGPKQADRERTAERTPGETAAAEKEDAENDEGDDQDERDEGDGGPVGEADGGPAFEVGDRRGSITANRAGIHFRLDDQEAEFPWDEIGAVEIRLPRLGRWFTVEVHLLNHRWFNADVEAPARSDLKRWEAELDAVLLAYVEDA